MKSICKNIAFSKTGECLLGEKCICNANKLWLDEDPDPSPTKEVEATNYCATEQYCEKHKRHHFGMCPDCPPPIVTTSSTDIKCAIAKEKQQPEGEISEDIMQWIKQHEKRLWEITAGEKGHPSNWENGAIAMYHKIWKAIEKQNVVILGHISNRQNLEAQIQALQKELNGYRISNQNIVDQNCSLLDERDRSNASFKRMNDLFDLKIEEANDYRKHLALVEILLRREHLPKSAEAIRELLAKYPSTPTNTTEKHGHEEIR